MKAEILVQQFKSVFTIDSNNTIPDTTKNVRDSIKPLTITTNGLEKLLRAVNPAKASGPDRIPNRILKECAPSIAPGLQAIFQRSVDTGELPSD